MRSASAHAIDPLHVAAAHDRMAAEYDQLDDLWYAWLFVQLHEFIGRHLPNGGPDAPRAVDAGCGTGFQSFLLARAGYRVTGIDLAADLLAAARAKCAAHAAPPLAAPPLFSTALDAAWIARHHRRLAARLECARGGRAVMPPQFERADLAAFDYGEGELDVLVCCGSVLSFVDGYRDRIARMAAALRRGGRLFLEVEQKRNLDLLWPAVDRLLGDALGYGQSWPRIAANLASRRRAPLRIQYPFTLHGGDAVALPIWLFSTTELEDTFRACGLRIVGRAGVHQITNLIPSTVLHRPAPGALMQRLFALLSRADATVARRWPFRRLGCSVAYCLERP